MNLDNDTRRLIVYAIGLVGLVALVGAIVLGGIIIVRLNSGEDIQPGTAAFLAGLVLIASNSGTLLAPSPLSKSSGADDPQPVEVVNRPSEPVPVESR